MRTVEELRKEIERLRDRSEGLQYEAAYRCVDVIEAVRLCNLAGETDVEANKLEAELRALLQDHRP